MNNYVENCTWCKMKTVILVLTLSLLLLGMTHGQQIYFTLGTDSIQYTTNNVEFLITDIGEDASLPSLTCNTDLATCCRSGDNNGNGGQGEWRYPDGTALLNKYGAVAAGQGFYSIRNAPQVIRLARRQSLNPLSPTGSYCCTVPTTGGDMTLCANIVVCLSLSLANGVVTYDNQGVGGVATHSCDPDYTLNGPSTRTCQSDGSWDGTAPTCETTCSDLTDPMNGMISYDMNPENARPAGTIATYSCNTGFVVSGDSTRTCMNDGTWSGSDPTCIAACPDIPPGEMIVDGSVAYDGGTTNARPEGVIATFACDTGFFFVWYSGNVRRNCQSDGTWSGRTPACEIVCPDLTEPANSAIAYSGVSANSGNGVGDPPSPVGGIQADARPVGIVATYSCPDSQFTLVGSATRTCQSDRSWSGSEPSCQMCNDLLQPTNGMVSYDDGSTNSRPVGTTATLSCSPGYGQSSGDTSRVCMNDGLWSGMQLVCVRDCGAPPTVADGSLDSNPPNTLEGSTVTYSCDSGFTLSGSAMLTCGNDGTWGTAPTCAVSTTTCSDLIDPVNGMISYDMTPENARPTGTIATYSCVTGFVVSGDSTRTCMSDGMWSGSDPTCTAGCPDIPPGEMLVDGSVEYFAGTASSSGTTNARPVGVRATFTCDTGFFFIFNSGNVNRNCQSDGTWSGSTPRCEIVCPDLPLPANTAIVYTGSSNGGPQGGSTNARPVGIVATYSCPDPQFTLVGSDTRTCQSDNSWSGDEPSCQSSCTDLTDTPANGDISYDMGTSDSRPPGTVATYSCMANFMITGSLTMRSCNDGSWTSGDAPTCTVSTTTCSDLIDPVNGMISYDMTPENARPAGTIATYSCVTGFVVSGDSTRTCMSDGMWSGSDPTCIAGCPDIPPGEMLVDGSVEYFAGSASSSGTTNARPVGVRATFTCDAGFFFVWFSGNVNRNCQSDGTWSGITPSCEIVCSDLTEPANSAIAYSGVSPNSADHPTTPVGGQTNARPVGIVATYSCPGSQFTLVGSPTRTCQSDGSWSGSEPSCQIPTVTCPTLTNPDNGVVVVNEDSIGGTASYSCNNDYSLVGDSSRTCMDMSGTGMWSGNQPTCSRICPELPAIANGDITYDPVEDPLLETNMATYSCVAGYELSTPTTRECQSDGTWSGAAPTCSRICSALPAIDNGITTYDPVEDPLLETNMATYSCVTGYELSAPTTRECQSDGTWSGAAPTCDLVDCGSTDLVRPVNGMAISVTNTTFGSTANYSCNPGFELTGDAVRTCQASGDWTPLAPTCNEPVAVAELSMDGSTIAGDSLTLTCSVSGIDSLSSDPSLMITYDIMHANNVDEVTRSTANTLTLDPLLLSDNGMYTCNITVTSTLLTSPLMDTSDGLTLMVQIPTPTVAIADPGPVFVGSSPELSCVVTVDSGVANVNPITATVVWDGPRGVGFATSTMVPLSSGSATATITLATVNPTDTGEYTCRATLASTSGIIASDEGSGTRTITIYGAPSPPTVTITPLSTALNVSWTQPDDELVEEYGLSLEYLGPCSDFSPPTESTTRDGTVRELTFMSLMEFSNYQISITATNGAGSNTSSDTAMTLPAAPDMGVATYSVSSFDSSSVTLSWGRVPCINRNSDITGYRIMYGSTQTVMLTGTDTLTTRISGLIPRMTYTFTIVPTSDSGDGLSRSLTQETALSPDVGLYLRGTFYTEDNIILDSTTISTGEEALHCVTDIEECCQSTHTGTTEVGDWFHPNGEALGFGSSNDPNMARGPSVVRFNALTTPASGLYRCVIPSSSETTTIHVGLYTTGEGAPTVSGVVFDRALTLTCTSTGGPATTVSWTRDSVPVSSTNYTFSQTVTDTATATYQNTLTAAIIGDLVGTFECTVTNDRGSDTGSITRTGVTIVDPPSSVTVGSSVTLTCELDAPGLIQWLDSTMTPLTSTTGSSLQYTIDPVMDSMHDSVLTCMGPGGAEMITINVDVPATVLDITFTTDDSAVAGEDYSVQCSVSTTVAGLTNMPTVRFMANGPNVDITSSGTMSNLTFTGLTTSQADSFPCQATLVSPALENPLVVMESHTITVQIPAPGVVVNPPSSTLYAGTPGTLTCSITVPTAVNTPVVVEVSWDNPITRTSTASGSVPSFTDDLSIAVLRTTHTMATCRARVRPASSTVTILNSAERSDTISITVVAPPAPTVMITESGSRTAGESLSLNCTATPGVPNLVSAPVVNWVGITDPTVTVAGGVLNFNPLRTSHGDVYTCEADYDISEANLMSNPGSASTTVTVQIPMPTPMITLDPMDDDNVYTVGLSLTITCVVTFEDYIDSPLTLGADWTRNSTALTTGNSLTVNNFTMPATRRFESSLQYSPLTPELVANDTLYVCDVTVTPLDETYITGTTANADITISVLEATFMVALTPQVTIPAGTLYTLSCQATRGPSSINDTTLDLEWLDANGDPVVGSPQLTITGDSSTTNSTIASSLVFPSIMTSQAGEYTCRVDLTIPGTDMQSIERRAVLNVQINSPDVMLTTNRPAFEGTTGQTLSCVITPDMTGVDTDTATVRELVGPGSSSPRFTETDTENSGVITLQQTVSLLILSDDGTYTCNVTVASQPSVSNAAYILSANVIQTLDLTVQVLPAPTVMVNHSMPSGVLAGSSYTLSCTATSVEFLAAPPVATWTNSANEVVGNGGELTFNPITTSNADNYTCTGSINIPMAGINNRSSTESARVIVIAPDPMVVLTTTTPIYHGTIHTFICNANYDRTVINTNVMLSFQWTLNGNMIANESLTMIQETDFSSTLVLNPVNQPSISSGDYVCTVTLTDPSPLVIGSNNQDSVILNVQGPPAINVQPGVPTRSGRCGQVETIQCDATITISIAAVPSVMWFFDGTVVDGDALLNYAGQTGEFTCTACVDVPAVNINDHCFSRSIVIEDAVLPPVVPPVCSSDSDTQLNVSWTPVSDQTLSYQVRVENYNTDSGEVGQSQLDDTEVLDSSITVSGLSAGVRYEVSIETVSGTGCSATSATVDCYTREIIPPDVENVTVARINGTAMRVMWNPINLVEARGFHFFTVTYTRTDPNSRRKRQADSGSVRVSGDQNEVEIGGLNPEDQYDVRVQAANGAGPSDASQVVVSPPTPAGDITGLLVGIIVVILILIVVVVVCTIVIVFMIRRYRSRGELKLSTARAYELSDIGDNTVQATSARPTERIEETSKEKEALDESRAVQPPAETPAEVLDRIKPISLTSFRNHVQTMHDDRAKGFEAEYQSFSLDPLQDHEIAKIPHNRAKNRFANIFPFDHSRVLLKEIPGVEGSDYINACWLDGYNRQKCYIAAQGPMPNSLEDFWRMIWEYRITNIVMLTKCKEGGRVKCEQYWVEDIGEVFETDGKLISVTTVSVVPFADFVVRQFTVKNSKEPDSEPLKVNQFHFTSWPDHGVPKFATSLIAFIRKTQRGHNKDSGPPLLVHCSAGVGRTGTFITLDSMLERIHKETSVNVYGFVKHMRSQRVLMVQTLAQYSFIHDALAELITCGETDIPAGALRTKFNLLSKVIPGKAITGFTNQFQLLEEVSRVIDTEDLTDANERFNKDKNRYPDRIPFNMSRARLRPTGEDGSEYINASFVDGYKHRNAYIATQAPLNNTVNDLWRMVWEFKSKTIVMLCNNQERGQESSAVYWPDKEDEVTLYGKINVTLQSKAPYGDFTVRKFSVQEERPAGAKQLEGFTVTQFHHTDWPLDGRPNTGTLIEMLDMITKQQMTTGNRPITVMCDDGCGRTGTMICIHAQLERLKTEGVVDFFQSIKSARIQRAGLVPDVSSYAYCHEVLTDYIDKFDNYANFKDMV